MGSGTCQEWQIAPFGWLSVHILGSVFNIFLSFFNFLSLSRHSVAHFFSLFFFCYHSFYLYLSLSKFRTTHCVNAAWYWLARSIFICLFHSVYSSCSRLYLYAAHFFSSNAGPDCGRFLITPRCTTITLTFRKTTAAGKLLSITIEQLSSKLFSLVPLQLQCFVLVFLHLICEANILLAF